MSHPGNPKPYDWQAVFLEALRHYPVVAQACEAAHIERSTAYRAREADKTFAQLWEEAIEVGIDRAEAEMFRRAVDGWLEPMTSGGAPIYQVERDPATGHPVMVEEEYTTFDINNNPKINKRMVQRLLLGPDGQPIPLTVRKRSDQLLQTIVKGRRRALYAERVEQTGANGGPTQSQIVVATGVPRADDFSDIA